MTNSNHAKFLKDRKQFLQSNSVDLVIFGFHEHDLKILLLQLKDLENWALPGGFIFQEEHMKEAAKRVLCERTGLKNISLKQFYTFSDPERTRLNNRSRQLKKQLDVLGHSAEVREWFLKRFVTTGYYALVEYTKVKPVPDEFSVKCEWHNISSLPPLVADHKEIIAKALETIRLQINLQPIGIDLLPKEFTLPEIQSLYEAVIGRKLDRRNFKKKISGYGILNQSTKKRTGVPYKAPFLYSFNKKAYQLAIRQGLRNAW
jgi:hypothetical protein